MAMMITDMMFRRMEDDSDDDKDDGDDDYDHNDEKKNLFTTIKVLKVNVKGWFWIPNQSRSHTCANAVFRTCTWIVKIVSRFFLNILKEMKKCTMSLEKEQGVENSQILWIVRNYWLFMTRIANAIWELSSWKCSSTKVCKDITYLCYTDDLGCLARFQQSQPLRVWHLTTKRHTCRLSPNYMIPASYNSCTNHRSQDSFIQRRFIGK